MVIATKKDFYNIVYLFAMVASIKDCSTSPPLSPSPSKERGRDIKREASPLFDSPLGVVELLRKF